MPYPDNNMYKEKALLVYGIRTVGVRYPDLQNIYILFKQVGSDF
ncbi:hypothetical protein MNB_SV-8-58 [hydrothermal vent metagenome]|uniref:Uncharacterized protein n=1 Tax=hydrothermal vent metagenome TaxID=652676 RepID=A0A1W1C2A5_9ZZZZ